MNTNYRQLPCKFVFEIFIWYYTCRVFGCTPETIKYDQLKLQ